MSSLAYTHSPHFGGAPGMGVTTHRARFRAMWCGMKVTMSPLFTFSASPSGSNGPGRVVQGRAQHWVLSGRFLSEEVAKRVLWGLERAQSLILVGACGGGG